MNIYLAKKLRIKKARSKMLVKTVQKILCCLLIFSNLVVSLPIPVAQAQDNTTPQLDFSGVSDQINEIIQEQKEMEAKENLEEDIFILKNEAFIEASKQGLNDIKTLDPETQPDSAELRKQAKIQHLFNDDFSAREKAVLFVENFTENNAHAVVLDQDGVQVEVEIEAIEQESTTLTTLKISPPQAFKPGKYTLKVTDPTTNNESTQDFTWGVLALNTNKSVYVSQETAKISIGVLDAFGEMVCNAMVELRITNEDLGISQTLSTDNKSIKVNEQCQQKTFSLQPDYEAEYRIPSVGVYNMTLIAQTPKGEYTIYDSFKVEETVPFDIERTSATRTFPLYVYPVVLNIKANQDFKGQVIDVVSENFDITQIGSKTEKPQEFNETDQATIKDAKPYNTVTSTTQVDLSRQDILGPNKSLTLPFDFNANEIRDTASLIAGFGDTPTDPLVKDKYSEYGLSGNDGLDFELPKSTPVLAVDDGTVVRALEDGDYGRTMVVQHSWGRSYYGHLEKFEAALETQVKKGQKIALSGDSGLSKGAHLHFAVKPNDNDFNNGYRGKVDPSSLFEGEPESESLGSIDALLSQSGSSEKVKIITWDIDIKKGESIKLGYNFKSPTTSPQFYQLGLLRLQSDTSTPTSIEEDNISQSTGFIEHRRWQIAIDSANPSIEQQLNIINQEYSTSSSTYAPTDKSLGLVAFDSSQYSGTLSLKFEAVIKATGLGSDVGSYTDIQCIESSGGAGDAASNCKIVYYDTTNSALLFFDCSDSTCSTGTRSIVDGDTGCGLTTGAIDCSTSADVGRYASLYCVTATDCKISYFDQTNGDLKVADCDDATCSTGTVTTIDQGGGQTTCPNFGVESVTVDTDCVGISSSIYCLATDNCKISYWNNANNDLMFYDCADATCATPGNIGATTSPQVVDGNTGFITGGSSGTSRGRFTSLVCFADDDCKITYAGNTVLFFADCADLLCNTGNISVLDGSSCVITGCTSSAIGLIYPSMVCLSDTDCKIAYRNDNNSAIRFIDCGTATCSSGTVTILDGEATCVLTGCSDGGGGGKHTYLSCLTANDCKIVAWDTGSSFLFIDCDTATCSSGVTGIIDGSTFNSASLTNASTDNIGQYGSMFCVTAVDCKIASYNSTDGDLRFADCDADTCRSGAGATPTIDAHTGAVLTGADADTSDNRGQFSDIYCVTYTDCKMVYYNATGTDLMFADCDDPQCSTGDVKTVDGDAASGLTNETTHSVGQYPSIYCPTSDDCKISYFDATNGDLKFADCGDENCSTGTISRPDQGGGQTTCLTPATAGDADCVGVYTSIFCPSATNCKISYWDNANQDLKYVDCDDAACSTQGSGSPRLIAGSGTNSGSYSSLYCISSTDCKISYYDISGADLEFIQCTDETCSTSVAGADVDTTNDVGRYTSVTCPTTDDCKVSYYDVSNTALKFVDCGNASCSSGNTARILDGHTGCVLTSCVTTARAAGEYSSISCPAENDCKVSYYNATDTALMVANCSESTCLTGTFKILDGFTACLLSTCSTANSIGTDSAIFCLSATECKISYYETTNTALKFADCDACLDTAGTATTPDGGASAALGLFNAAGSQVACNTPSSTNVEFSTTSQSYVRLRTGEHTSCTLTTAQLTDTNYTVQLKAVGGGTVYVKAARLIIIHTDPSNLTKTETQVEIGANTTTTATTATALTNPKYYLYDDEEFDPDPQAAENGAAYFEATIKNPGVPGTPTSIANVTVGAGALDTAHTGCDGTATSDDWLNPGNITASDASKAVAFANSTVSASQTSDCLLATTFNLTSIPSTATITGVVVEIEKSEDNTGDNVVDSSIQLIKGGTPTGDNKADAVTEWPVLASEAYVSYGTGTTDMWGLALTPSDFTNDTNFGVKIQAAVTSAGGTTVNARIDHVRMTVYYTPVSAAATTTVELYDRTAAAAVSGSELTNATGTWSLQRTASTIALVDDHEYEVRIKSSNSSATAYIANAKLVLVQESAGGCGSSGIADVQLAHSLINSVETDTNSTYASPSSYNYFNSSSSFGGGTFAYYFEADLKASANTANAKLTLEGTDVTSSGVSHATTSYSRQRSSSLTLSSAGQLDSPINNSSAGTTSVSNSLLLIEASGLGSGGGGLTTEIQMRHGNHFCEGVEQYFSF